MGVRFSITKYVYSSIVKEVKPKISFFAVEERDTVVGGLPDREMFRSHNDKFLVENRLVVPTEVSN